MVKDNRRQRKQSTEQLVTLTWVGILAEAVGWTLWALGQRQSGDGATLLQAVGLLIVSIGSALVFVALVGWGVLIGIRAHKHESV